MRSILRWVVAMGCVAAIHAKAHAESGEATMGVNGGVLFPAFSSPNPTAFALATWTAGFEAQYGLTDALDLRGAFGFSTFEGHTVRTTHYDGREFTGDYHFRGVYYHPELGVRYKVYGGYNLAPYIEASLGYLWGVYSQASIAAARDSNERLHLRDSAEGTFSAGAGVAMDYRLFNTLFAGVAVRYAYLLGDSVSKHYLSLPLTVSFYW